MESTHTLPPFLDPRASQYDMYQQLPYVKNIELCTPDTIRLVSGNMLKYYMIINLPETVIINTNSLAEFLVEQGKRASLRYHSRIVPKPQDIIDASEEEAVFQPGITPVSVLEEKNSASASGMDTVEHSRRAEAGRQPEDDMLSDEEDGLTNPFSGISEDDDDFSFLRG